MSVIAVPSYWLRHHDLFWVELGAIELQFLTKLDEKIEVLRLGTIIEGGKARRIVPDVLLLNLLGFVRIFSDELKALVYGSSEILDSIRGFLDPIAVRE